MVTSLRMMWAGVAAVTLAIPALADTTAAIATSQPAGTAEAAAAGDAGGRAPGTVVVSCFRGPWRETLWDRPEGVFLDSLVGLGYDYTAAEAIGERVCKDVTLVGDPAALQAAVERILAASPAGR